MRLARFLTFPVLLLVGGFVGLCSVALHTWWWGLALAWVGSLGLGWVIPAGWTTRVPYAAGWIVVLWRAMTPRHTGAYAVGSDTAGYALLAGGLLLVLLTSTTVPIRRRSAGRAAEAAAGSASPTPPAPPGS